MRSSHSDFSPALFFVPVDASWWLLGVRAARRSVYTFTSVYSLNLNINIANQYHSITQSIL